MHIDFKGLGLVSSIDDLLADRPDVLTVKEVAELLRMSTGGIRLWIRRDVLPAIHVEDKVMILKSDLRALLERSYRQGGTSE